MMVILFITQCIELNVPLQYAPYNTLTCTILVWFALLVRYIFAGAIYLPYFQVHMHRVRFRIAQILLIMMTSSNGIIFRVTGPLCREFTGHRWIPHTKASDVEI